MWGVGLDPRNAQAAIDRACQLIEELGCGRVVRGIAEDGIAPAPLVEIPFEPERINRFLGTEIPAAAMLDIFRRLELVYEEENRYWSFRPSGRI